MLCAPIRAYYYLYRVSRNNRKRSEIILNQIQSFRIVSVDSNQTRFIRRERKSSYIIIGRFPIFTQHHRPMGSRAEFSGPLKGLSLSIIYYIYNRGDCCTLEKRAGYCHIKIRGPIGPLVLKRKKRKS